MEQDLSREAVNHSQILDLLLNQISFTVFTQARQKTHSFLWHYATSRKVAGSITDEVTGFFN
jgi:hypothetical protein